MRPCENVNFCLFCECAYLHNGVECSRDECVVNQTVVKWWEMSLYPRPLISSNPPPGMHQVYSLYAEKDKNGKYQPRMVVETTPKE